jgi:hypothetical protein
MLLLRLQNIIFFVTWVLFTIVVLVGYANYHYYQELSLNFHIVTLIVKKYPFSTILTILVLVLIIIYQYKLYREKIKNRKNCQITYVDLEKIAHLWLEFEEIEENIENKILENMEVSFDETKKDMQEVIGILIGNRNIKDMDFYKRYVFNYLDSFSKEELEIVAVLYELLETRAKDLPSVATLYKNDTDKTIYKDIVSENLTSYEILYRINLFEHTMNVVDCMYNYLSKEKDTFVFGWAKMLIVSLAHDIGKIEKIESLRGLSSFEKGKYEHNTHENLSRLIISNAFPGYKYVEEVCEIIEKHHIQVVDEKNKNYKEIKKLKFADQEARRLEIKNYLTTKKDTSIINQKPKEPISELVQKEEDNPIKESTPKEEVMDVFNNAENAVKEDTSIVIEAKNEEDKSEQNIKINIDENIEISQAEKPIKLPNNDDIEKENISSEKKVHTIKEDGYNEVLDMEAFGSFIQSLVSSINTTEMTSQKRLRPVSISDKDELFVPVEIYLKLLKNAKFDVSDKKKIDMVTRQLKTDGVLKYETSKIALDGFSNFAYKQRRTYFVFSLDFLNVTQDEVALKKRNEENLRNVSIVRS